MTHDLSYAPARPSPIRRWWRRLRWPLLGTLLVIALLLTPAIYRRASRHLADRQVHWWRQVAESAPPIDFQSGPKAPEKVARVRAIIADFEPHLEAALHHRDSRVRTAAAEAVEKVSWWFRPAPRIPPVDPPLFSRATHDLFVERLLSGEEGMEELRSAVLVDRRPIDLRPAVAAWPGLRPVRRRIIMVVLFDSGPQTPGAGELLRFSARDADVTVRRQGRFILIHWLKPPSFAWHTTGGGMAHWRMPDGGRIMDPAVALDLFAGAANGRGQATSSATAVLWHFGPMLPERAAVHLPALDAQAAVPPDYTYVSQNAAAAAAAIRAALEDSP